MNREFLFRGKCPDNSGWVYGDLQIGESNVIIATKGRHILYYIQPDTVGRYIGLKDNKGNKIFEGDILYHDGKYFGVVMWHPDGYFFINDRKDPQEVSINDSFCPIGRMLRTYDFTVCGNIFDNP